MDKSLLAKLKRTEMLAALGLTVLVLGGAGLASETIFDASGGSGLVAEYRFDTGGGETLYDTSGDSDASITGASWESGIEGSSLSFDGNDDYVYVRQSGVPEWYKGRDLSFSAWFKTTEKGTILGNTGGNDGDPSSNSGFVPAVVVNSEGEVGVSLFWHGDTSWVETEKSFNDGRWHHVAGTYGNGQERVFVDGKLRNTRTGLSQQDYNNGNYEYFLGTASGTWQNMNNPWFEGKIDNAKFYSTELNKSDVESVYNSGSWRIGESKEEDKSKVLEIDFEDQNSTQVLDTSGKENHGEPRNGASQEKANMCKVGRCYSFDGSDDWVQLSDAASSEPVTFMGWSKTSGGDSNHEWMFMQYDSDEGFSNDFELSPKSGFWTADTQHFSFNYADGEWHHYSIILNGSESALYVDGELIGNFSTDFNDLSDGDFLLGQKTGSNYFTGKMDQIKVFNRSLTQSEIIEETEGLDSSGAVLDLRFDSDGGDKVLDRSSEGFHGELRPNESAGPDRVDGVSGGALEFDGSNDLVYVGGKDKYAQNSATISTWVKPKTDDSHKIITKSRYWNPDTGGFAVAHGPLSGLGDSLGFKLSDGSFTSNDNHTVLSGPHLRTGKWHHVAAKYDSQRASLFVDGERVDSGSTSHITDYKDGHGVKLGADNVGYGNIALDRFKVFPFKLSDSQIEEIYTSESPNINSGTSQNESGTGLVLAQSFDRVENCGQSDTISCPSGMSGEIAVDESGRSNHGEIFNDVEEKLASKCQAGQCLSFNRSEFDEAVKVEEENIPSGVPGEEITFSAWVKSKEVGGGQSIISNYGEWEVNLENSGEIWLRTSGGNTGGTSEIVESDEWEHVAVRWIPGSKATIFHNGERVQKVSITDNSTDNGDPYWIGAEDTDFNGQPDRNFFDGSIDEVKIYNKSLTDQEIWKLYTRGRDRSSEAGPVGHWRFDSVSGDKTYDSAEDQTGTVNGANLTKGRKGSALEFDGNDDRVEVADLDALDITDELALTAWVKPDSSTWQAIVSRKEQVHNARLLIDSSDQLTYETSAGNIVRSTETLSQGEWQHVSLVLEDAGSDIKATFYVDGEFSNQETINSDSVDWRASNNLWIGGNDIDVDYVMDGKLDDVRIYPYTLSQGQVLEIMNSGAVGSSSKGNDYSVPEDCKEIHSRQNAEFSSTYRIDPDGEGGYAPFEVHCEMKENGGGWTRLNLRNDAHTGQKGLPFGYDYSRTGAFWSDTDSVFNWGAGPSFFQKDGNNRCTVYGIGNSTKSTYNGKETLWDYYDANGKPIPPAQIEALSETTEEGTYYDGSYYVRDIDGPFPNGGDGDGGINSFNIRIDPDATHSPTGGGPLVLWFSNSTNMDAGTSHAIGSDYDSGEGEPVYDVNWKVVHNTSVPRYMGAKVDNNDNVYSTFNNGCERQLASNIEFENPYFHAK